MYHMEIPTPIKELEKAKTAIKKAEKRYEAIKDGLTSYDPEITERSTVLCNKCGKRSQIKNVTFSRYYWYESPHGCMGGDTWHTDGFIVVCPKCDKWNHAHKPTKALPNYDIQKMEYRMIEKMLRFAQQHGDIRYSNCKYKCTEEIEWEHK